MSVTLTPVKSSNIAAIGYDNDAAQLHVQFIGKPGVHRYKEVPQAVYEALMACANPNSQQTVGQKFAAEVRNVYDHIGPDDEKPKEAPSAIAAPRELTDHIVNPVNDALRIIVADQPGAGGACHVYIVRGSNQLSNPSFTAAAAAAQHGDALVMFQNGPIGDAGINGLTHEVLAAIVIDRLRSFQKGPYACTANEEALQCFVDGLTILKARTRERMARGVEGTHTV